MENLQKTITAEAENEYEFELPEEIIQHIQSCFMDERDAARTTLLSKSWYRAWSTRPNLVFDKFDFRRGIDLLGEITNKMLELYRFQHKTMKRYEDLNLNIRSLMLRIDDLSLAKELIVKAIKLGVVDLKIQIPTLGSSFDLPDELYESQTLARLYLSGSFTLKKGSVSNYSNLKSLELDSVAIHGDLFRYLISRCPLIEELSLHSIMSWFGHEERRRTPFYDSSSIKLDEDEFDNLVFPNLKYLCIEFMDIKDTLSMHRQHDFWSKFPCLKELKISNYHDDVNDVRISIPSLERISISLSTSIMLNGEFDFPNIRKFEFEGALPRSFELKTTSGSRRRDEWESKIHISYDESEPGEWFSRLSQFLRMLSLSRSRVSLSIEATAFHYWDEFNYHPIYVGDGLAIPAVEELKLMKYQVTAAFLDALFWSCRPKFVKIQNQCLFGLKKVNMELFQQLQSLPWETFYNVSWSKYHEYDVRFQLN